MWKLRRYIVYTFGVMAIYYSLILLYTVSRPAKYSSLTRPAIDSADGSIVRDSTTRTSTLLPQVKTTHEAGWCAGRRLRQGKEFTWQEMTPTSFAFAAHIDDREGDLLLRIIALQNRTEESPKECLVYYSGQEAPLVTGIELKENPESRRKKYSAFLYTCNLVKEMGRPCGVQLQFDRSFKPHFLPVKVLYDGPMLNFTVCIPPLHNYGNIYQLVQMVEMNRLMGANKFFMYIFSATRHVNRYLDYYTKLGLVELIQWNLPEDVRVDMYHKVHYFGQLAAINDCLYRNIDRSQYIVFLDLDEVIVPKNGSSWHQIISVHSSPQEAAFYFMNRFFDATCFRKSNILQENTTFPVDKGIRQKALKYKVEAILLSTSANELFRVGNRSKIIVKRVGPVDMGIHAVHAFSPGYRSVTIDPALAYLHHYRMVTRSCDLSRKMTAHSYLTNQSTALLERIAAVHEALVKRN